MSDLPDTPPFKCGWIEGIDPTEIYVRLSKDGELDHELWIDIDSLPKQQRDYIAMGQMVRFNMETHEFQMLDFDGTNWVMI